MNEVEPPTPPAPSTPTPPAEKPYAQEGVTPADEVVKQWKPALVNGDWIFSGDCPRCNHRWEKAITEEVMVTAFESKVPEREDEGLHVVICNCTHSHPGRPNDVPAGCGAYWGIRVRRIAAEGPSQ